MIMIESSGLGEEGRREGKSVIGFFVRDMFHRFGEESNEVELKNRS